MVYLVIYFKILYISFINLLKKDNNKEEKDIFMVHYGGRYKHFRVALLKARICISFLKHLHRYLVFIKQLYM